MRKRLAMIGICAGLSVLLSSCGTATKLAEKAKEAVNASSTANEKKEMDKYNKYIDLSNYITQWLDTMFVSYFKEFGVEEELQVKKNFRGFQTFPVLKAHQDDLDKALEFASKKPSYEAVDRSVQTLVPKMKQLMSTMEETQTYYNDKTYENDQFAKGKELHKQIIVQYEEFAQLADAFFNAFEAVTDQKKREDMEQLKKNDSLVRYYAMSIVMRSQDIQEAFSEAGVGDENVLDFDVNLYTEKYNLLIDDINKFTEYSKDPERLKKERLGIPPVFPDSVERVKTAATDILEVLRTQEVKISRNQGKMTTGGKPAPLMEFDRKVSSLVNSYNTMMGIQSGRK